MSRFLKTLISHEPEIRIMAKMLLEGIREYLPDFGADLAMDSKAISSLSNSISKKTKVDGCRELEWLKGTTHHMTAYKGYDDVKLILMLKEEFGVHAVIAREAVGRRKEAGCFSKEEMSHTTKMELSFVIMIPGRRVSWQMADMMKKRKCSCGVVWLFW